MEENNNVHCEYVELTHKRPITGGSYNLEGRLSQYKDSLRKDYDDLRKELENKIENKYTENKQEINRIELENKKLLSIQWFVWVIIAIATAVTGWWYVSYNPLLDWRDEAIKQIHEIDIKSEINKANLENTKSREFPITVDEKGFLKLKE